MAGEIRVGLGQLAEALDLGACELEVAVGGGEVTHQADDVPARRREQLRQAEAPHAGIELDVDANVLGDVGVGNGDLEPGVASSGDLVATERRHHEDARGRVLGPHL